MKKSVDDLLATSQDVINSGLSQALSTTASALSTTASTLSLNRERRRSPSPSSRSINISMISSSSSARSSTSIFGKSTKNDTQTSPTNSKLDNNEEIPNKLDENSPGLPSKELNKSQEDLKDGKDKEKSKPSSKMAERAKKKAWYHHGLYPSYKSRSEDFKKLFKDVPDDERLVVGKEKVAKVIPNAILITTENDKHFLTSFTSRDKTYLMLFRVWQNALMDKPMNPQELWQWVHSCYGEQLGLTTDDEDYIDPYDTKLSNDSVSEEPSLNEKVSSSSSGKLNESSSKKDNKKDKKDSKEKKEKKESKKDKSKNKKIAKQTQLKEPSSSEALNVSATEVPSELIELPKSIASKTIEQLPTDMSDSTDSETEKNNLEQFKNDAECTSMHEGRQLVHTIVPINIDTMFSLLFSKSKFFMDFHKERKTTDLIQGEWCENEDGLKERVLNLTIAITQSVGPKSSRVTETQVMRSCTTPGQLYSIDATSVNAGIPYADSFYVLLHYCLKRTTDDHTVISVHAQIKYKKSVWSVVKGFIEKNTWAGLEEFYKALVQAMQQELRLLPTNPRHPRRPKRQGSMQQQQAPIISITKQATIEEVPQISQTQHSKHIFTMDDRMSNTNTTSYNKLSWVVIILLLGLLVFNVILYVKLWNMEDRNDHIPDISSMKNPPKSPEEWIRLLQLQESLHAKEMRKWQRVLSTALELMKKTEQSLSDLQNLIIKQRSKSPTEIDLLNYKSDSDKNENSFPESVYLK